MSTLGPPKGMSLRDYEQMIRSRPLIDPVPIAPVVDVPADGGPVGADPSKFTPRNIDVGSTPYSQRSYVSRILGAPLDLYAEGAKAVGAVDPNYEQVGGSESINRFFNLTASNILNTPGAVSSLAGVGVAATKAAEEYLTSGDKDPSYGELFKKNMFTDEGAKALDQKQADIAQSIKQQYPAATPEQIKIGIDNWFKSEEGYQFLSDQMTPLMKFGRDNALAAHKAMGLAGTPDDLSYSDEAQGIVGGSLVAVPNLAVGASDKVATSAIGAATQKFLNNSAVKVAAKTAELLTPVTVPATKGAIAANATVGLLSNDVLRAVSGQPSATGSVYDNVQQATSELADSIEQVASGATGDVPNIDPVLAAGAGIGSVALVAAGLRSRGIGAALHSVINNTPATTAAPATVKATAQNLASTTTGNAGHVLPTVAQTVQQAVSSEPSVGRRAADLAVNLVDESAPLRHAVRNATNDPNFVDTVDALHQNLVAGGGRNLDAAAVGTGTFANGDKISSVDWRKLNSDVEMIMRDPKSAEDFTNYANMLQELSVRKKATEGYLKDFIEARDALAQKPNSLPRMQAANDAYNAWRDSQLDSSPVGRQNFLQLADSELRTAITQFESNPSFKDISTRMQKVGKELLDLRLKNGLIDQTEYKQLSSQPYYLRQMADYSSQRTWLGNLGRKIEKAVDYTQPSDYRGRGYAGLTSINYEKGTQGEITKFANPIDAMHVGVFELSKDLRQESFKRQLLDGLEARGVKIVRETYNREKHGDVYNEQAARTFIPYRDASTGRLIVAKGPKDLNWLVNRTPEVYGIAEQLGNFWRNYFQRGITGPLRGISSIVNQGMTAFLTPLALAHPTVKYNPATILKGLRYSVENSGRELLSGTVQTVKAALLDTPLFRALNVLPNGPQVVDGFLTSLGERLKSNYMHELEELGVSPTAMVQGLPVVGPNYSDQFRHLNKAAGNPLNPMNYSEPVKKAFGTYAKAFEQILSGPRLAVLDDQLNALRRKYGTQDIHAVPDAELRKAIQRAREIEGDYMRNVGSPTLRKGLSLIPYSRVTVQGNLIVLKRLEDALAPLGKGSINRDNLTALSRLVGFGIMPKLISLGLIAAAGKQTMNWYWGERTDQQRMREWHFPKKLEDLIGLSNKMMFGTEYKEVPPSDWYVMRGPPDTSWIADAVVEGMRALLPGSLDKKHNVKQPMGAPDWYDPTLWQLAGRWAQSALSLDVPLIDIYKKLTDTSGQVSAADRERDTNYIGARTQDILTAALGMVGTGIGQTVNTYAASGSLSKAAKQFDETLGITHASPLNNVSDVPILFDAPTRYTASNTLMNAVYQTEKQARSAAEFLTQINNTRGNRIPIHIAESDLSTLKLMAETINNTINKNGQYKQYDKAFDSYRQAARMLDSVKGRRDFEPEQRATMSTKLNRYAHRAAETKIAILSKLKDQLAEQYGDYFQSKGIDPSNLSWADINSIFNNALNRR